MTELEKRPTGLLHSGEEIRKLIMEHPDLPLVILANDEANTGEYSTMFCSSLYAEVGEFLDCMQEIEDEHAFTDREEFEDYVADSFYDFDGSEKEKEQAIENRIMEYEPYWKPCIIVTVGN